MSHLSHTLTLPLWFLYGPLSAAIAILLALLQGTLYRTNLATALIIFIPLVQRS